MLVGHGALNGREFNNLLVDGGSFALDIDPFFTIAFDVGGIASRVHALEGSADTSINLSAVPAYRASLYGSAGIRIAPTADLSRSAFGHWAQARRETLPDADRGMHVEWQDRTITVPADPPPQPKKFRIMRVSPERRVISVPAEPVVLVRQKEPAL